MELEKQQEISFKEFINKLSNLFTYFKSKWLLLFGFGVFGGLFGLLAAYLAKPKYTSELTFVLSTNNKTSGLAGLAGQFGIDLGNNNDDLFAGDNIIELFKSRKIIKGALFQQMPNSTQSLINFLIDKTEIQKKWSKKEYLKSLMPFPNNVNDLTPVQDSLIGEIHKSLVEKNIYIDKIDKKLSFYKVSVTSTDEMISCYLNKYIVDEAAKFYIQTKTKIARQNLQMLQNEADSIRDLLGGTIVVSGEEADKTFNLNPAYQVQRSTAQQSQIKTTVLGTAYGEIVKNLEIAKITLQKETPLYQKIDEPQLPLKKEKFGKFRGLISGGIIGICLISIILFLKLLFKKIVN